MPSDVPVIEQVNQAARWRRWLVPIGSLVIAAQLSVWLVLVWYGTLEALTWYAAVALFALPCIVATGLVLIRGRRFGLRSLIAATTVLAGFFAFLAQPVWEERNSRSITRRLSASGLAIDGDNYMDEYYASFGEPSGGSESTSQTPFPWIRPLIADMPDVRADQIIGVGLRSDDDVELLLQSINDLPNLRNIRVFGTRYGPGGGSAPCVTPAGLERLSRELPPMDAITLIDIQIPPDSCGRFEAVHHLSIIFTNPTLPASRLKVQQLQDIASTRGVEILTFSRCRLTDQDAMILAKAPELRHLDLHNTNVSATGKQTIEQENPDLQVHRK